MMALSMLVMDSKTINPRTVKTAPVMSIKVFCLEYGHTIGRPHGPRVNLETLRVGLATVLTGCGPALVSRLLLPFTFMSATKVQNTVIPIGFVALYSKSH